ncbi:MAG: polyprenol monophosphomannose synthase [Bacteroidales bacterium]|nr:polyprenol monophosphomannose synthase [Bacteroidales bacterium]
MPDSLVIIPMYNERENAAAIIDAVLALEGQHFDILVIDDNSPDGTAAIVKEKMAANPGRVHIIERAGKLGLGTAYIEGFKWALEHPQYKQICEMDADFSHAPADLLKLRQAVVSGEGDVAVGSRYLTGVNVVNWPMGRVLMSYFASKYVRFVTRMPVHDTTAGFVCYSRDVLDNIDLDKIRFKGYAFQIEMKFTAHRLDYKVVEVPIVFVNRVLGTSKMSGGIFSEAFFGVLRLKASQLFGKKLKRRKAQA